MTNAYRFAIEEEYFLSNTVTRDACRTIPRHFVEACEAAFPGVFGPEFLQSQIEVATPSCSTLEEARARLSAYRIGISRIAGDHGLTMFASGTHPLASWTKQRQTETPRYDRVRHDLQMLGARNMVCGMHVHVETPHPERRSDLMVRAMPFIPLLLALSTSSPFWQAKRTGLMGYRLAAYEELPRTGLPELFIDDADYRAFIDTMVETRAIADSSYVWWVIRPSLDSPTLELRVADSCTHVSDGVRIALLFRCIVRHLDLNPHVNARLTAANRAIIAENKWRAQRYGIHGSFIDEKEQRLVSVSESLDRVLALITPDMEALDCADELYDLRDILDRGTSADRQISIYTSAKGNGRSQTEALSDVVDWLCAMTSGEAGFR
ncbi:MAG: carboxylate-amine ligase [Beijerinckiaceae bacterium]|nr:carboxylate-amine ligase [Beijerinckiaceae bacterium]